MSSTPSSLLPESWRSISSITPLNVHDLEAEIKPSSAEGAKGRRARAAGKLGSLLRVRGSSGNDGGLAEEEEVILGLSLLRLEAVDGDLSVHIGEKDSSATPEQKEEEAGVNAAGGLAPTTESKLPVGEWRVKAFKETLADAK